MFIFILDSWRKGMVCNKIWGAVKSEALSPSASDNGQADASVPGLFNYIFKYFEYIQSSVFTPYKAVLFLYKSWRTKYFFQ